MSMSCIEAVVLAVWWRRKLGRSLAIPVVIWLCVAGCAATFHMRLAAELGAVEPMAVRDRQVYAWSKALKFGPWQVTTASAPHSQLRSTSIDSQSKELSADRSRLAFELELSSDEASTRGSTRVNCQAIERVAKLTRFNARLADETEIILSGFPRIDCQVSGAVVGTLQSRSVSETQRDWAAVASALLYYVTALEMHGH